MNLKYKCHNDIKVIPGSQRADEAKQDVAGLNWLQILKQQKWLTEKITGQKTRRTSV